MRNAFICCFLTVLLCSSGCFLPWPHRAQRVSTIHGMVTTAGEPTGGVRIWYSASVKKDACQSTPVNPVESDGGGLFHLEGLRTLRAGHIIPLGPTEFDSSWSICLERRGPKAPRRRWHAFVWGPPYAPDAVGVRCDLSHAEPDLCKFDHSLIEPERPANTYQAPGCQ